MGIALIFLILAFTVIFYTLSPDPESHTVSLGEKVTKIKSKKNPILQPFYPLAQIFLKGPTPRNKLRDKLQIGKWNILPEDFMVRKVLFGVGAPMLLYLFGMTDILYLIMALFIGFFLPEFMLNNKVKKRKKAIVKVLPETVDLLSLCVGAGLDFLGATRWIIAKVKPNAMIEELKSVVDEVNLGKSRVESLKNMSKRLGISEITSFVRILVQAEKIGSPVEEAFTIVSEDNRRIRKTNGQRQALKAPLKMLIPLLFIMGILLIIVGGPILLGFMQGSLFSGG